MNQTKRKIELYFPILPQAIQSARFNSLAYKSKAYQPQRNISYKRALRYLCLEQLPVGFELLEGALEFHATFVFPYLKSMSKKDIRRIEAGEIIYKPTRPDLQDNLHKGTCDALTGVIWHDDAQICRVVSEKYFGMKPEIKITVTEL